MYGARLSAQASRLHANSWNNNASQAPQYKYIAAARPVQILYALHTSDHVCRVTVYCLGKELFMWQVLWIIINIGAGGAIGGSLAPSVFEAISKCWVSELGRDADWLITYPESGLDTPGTCHSVAMHSYDRTSDRLPTWYHPSSLLWQPTPRRLLLHLAPKLTPLLIISQKIATSHGIPKISGGWEQERRRVQLASVTERRRASHYYASKS